jgi:hypothetical protein
MESTADFAKLWSAVAAELPLWEGGEITEADASEGRVGTFNQTSVMTRIGSTIA